MSLAFSIVLHYFSSSLFIHVVTASDSTFSSGDGFPLYVFCHHTSYLVSHFFDDLDIFPYGLWFNLLYSLFNFLLKNFGILKFSLLFDILLFLVCTDGF